MFLSPVWVFINAMLFCLKKCLWEITKARTLDHFLLSFSCFFPGVSLFMLRESDKFYISHEFPIVCLILEDSFFVI